VEAEDASKQAIYETIKEVLELESKIDYDPDDYMASGCPDGFCPMPNTRIGPSEPLFDPIN
jgi:hypothetical protein